jgi:hypothetical protein
VIVQFSKAFSDSDDAVSQTTSDAELQAMRMSSKKDRAKRSMSDLMCRPSNYYHAFLSRVAWRKDPYIGLCSLFCLLPCTCLSCVSLGVGA